MRVGNMESENLMKEAAEELGKKDVEPLLMNLQQKIVECYEVEEKAFRTLDSIIR
jgi:hypothetical protein